MPSSESQAEPRKLNLDKWFQYGFSERRQWILSGRIPASEAAASMREHTLQFVKRHCWSASGDLMNTAVQAYDRADFGAFCSAESRCYHYVYQSWGDVSGCIDDMDENQQILRYVQNKAASKQRSKSWFNGDGSRRTSDERRRIVQDRWDARKGARAAGRNNRPDTSTPRVRFESFRARKGLDRPQSNRVVRDSDESGGSKGSFDSNFVQKGSQFESRLAW